MLALVLPLAGCAIDAPMHSSQRAFGQQAVAGTPPPANVRRPTATQANGQPVIEAPRDRSAPAAQPPTETPAADAAESATAASATVQATDATTSTARTDRQQERALREAFAAASPPREQAIRLASFLTGRERFKEALFVIERALQEHARANRTDTTMLRIVRAGLLRDLADCAGAAKELRSLQQDVGADQLAPATLFDLATVEWLAGERKAARDSLALLRRVHDKAPWLREHLKAVQALERSLGDKRVLDAAASRDMLALLRGAPLVTARLKMLDRLAMPTGTASDVDREPVRLRAISIASNDESKVLRTRAVQLAARNRIVERAYWRTMLDDPDALVRRTSAKACASTLARSSAPLLLAQLATESAAACREALHKALATAVGPAPAGSPMPSFAFADDAGRDAAVAYWRARCQ